MLGEQRVGEHRQVLTVLLERARRHEADGTGPGARSGLDPGQVREPVLDGRRVRANADRGAAAVPSVVSALEAAGIGIASVTVARPSLDDVYLRHTGRDYRNANGESYA